MARRSRRGFSRGPKNNIWTVVQIEDLVISLTPFEANIVQPSEIQGAATSFQRFTLLRIRGWLSAAPNVVNVAAGSFVWAIYVTDEDAVVRGPLDTILYTDDDVLATGGVQFGISGAGAVERNVGKTWDIDVKAMRKIDSGKEVRLTVESSVGNLTMISGVIRGLVRKGGN